MTDGADEEVALSERIEANSVPPRRFKAIMGRHCADYGTAQQQDASYFFMHFLSLLEHEERAQAPRLAPVDRAPPCSRLFAYSQEQRVQCGVSGAVSYTAVGTTQLSLRIPLDAAANRKEVDEYKARESTRQVLVSNDVDAYIGATVRCASRPSFACSVPGICRMLAGPCLRTPRALLLAAAAFEAMQSVAIVQAIDVLRDAFVQLLSMGL